MERYGNIKGGKVIGTGSYGCVFSPALPCKDGRQPSPDMVSKLMETKDAQKEMSEIENVTTRLVNIPDAEKYFGGFGTYLCEAEEITPEDVKGYKCDINNVTSLVNDNRSPLELPGLSILQQKNLGKSITEYLENVSSKKDLKSFFKNMLNLLIKGIIPMNKIGVYHLDIKGENILVKNNKPVLIDWGLSFLTKNGEPISDAETRGQVFDDEKTNVPMTAFCMFNEPLVARAFYQTAHNRGGMLDSKGLSGVNTVRTIIHYLIHNRPDSDHMRYLMGGIINPVIEIMTQFHRSKGQRYLYNNSADLLTEYLTQQRDLYSTNGRVNHNKLYADFFYNVDIWGWVMSFAPFLRSDISGSGGKLSRILDDRVRRTIRLTCAKMIEYLLVSKNGRYDVGFLAAYTQHAVSIL